MYVLLLKESEDATQVIYRFGPNETQMGRLSFDKQSGQATELEPAPVPNDHHLFIRAVQKIRQHARTGQFPARTVWASG